MTESEVMDLSKALEIKQEKCEKLTVGELTIFGVHRGLKKEGKEITEETIEKIIFMMD